MGKLMQSTEPRAFLVRVSRPAGMPKVEWTTVWGAGQFPLPDGDASPDNAGRPTNGKIASEIRAGGGLAWVEGDDGRVMVGRIRPTRHGHPRPRLIQLSDHQILEPGQALVLRSKALGKADLARWPEAAEQLAGLLSGGAPPVAFARLSDETLSLACAEFLRRAPVEKGLALHSLVIAPRLPNGQLGFFGACRDGRELLAAVHRGRLDGAGASRAIALMRTFPGTSVLFAEVRTSSTQGGIRILPLKAVETWLHLSPHYLAALSGSQTLVAPRKTWWKAIHDLRLESP